MMRLISGNGLAFLEAKRVPDSATIYISVAAISAVAADDKRKCLVLSERGSSSSVSIEGTIPELFSTLGCNFISDSSPLPF